MSEQRGLREQQVERPSRPVGTSPADTGRSGLDQSLTPGLAIIASKIRPAAVGASVLTRPRLVGWLDQQRSARVVLVLAEAGWGKSTLLADYSLRTDSVCLWYRLETSDSDWITYLSYLVAAVREAFPDFGRPTEALLRHVAAMGPSREVVVAQFLADLHEVEPRDVVLILDDFHLVDASDDVKTIMGRLFERAPRQMRFILAGRAKPSLMLGRLGAQGRITELTTGDLRFTRSEIGQLFANAYSQPLEDDVCDIVAERTQGWAASLQLVSASIKASRPSEVAGFIRALSGAEGPIYDFLAEEVLSRLSPLTQEVLLHASLIDRVTPELVGAAMSVSPAAPSIGDVAACLRDTETLGLLTQREDSGADLRIHPLLREFLEHRLRQVASTEALTAMHSAIAREAEATDWLVAGKHFAMAQEPDEAMRVLGSAASQALGTGAWGAAAEVIASMPDTTPPPAVEVIKARALVTAGHPEDALAALDGIIQSSLDPREKALVSLARAGALQMSGQTEELWSEIEVLNSLAHGDSVVGQLACAWSLITQACQGGSIGSARRALDELAAAASKSKLGHFAGIALHNSATAALAQGDFREAIRLAIGARTALVDSPPDASIGPSAMITQAIALAELGRLGDGCSLADEALAANDAHPDVIADGSYLAAILGDVRRAELLDYRLRRLLKAGPTQVGALHQAAVARIARLVASGDFNQAASQATDLSLRSQDELDGLTRGGFLSALTSVLTGSPDAATRVRRALDVCFEQQAWRWESRLRILEAVTANDREHLAHWISTPHDGSTLAVLETADAIGTVLSVLDPVPDGLAHSIGRFSNRWLPVLRRQLQLEPALNGHVAARLLSDFGTKDDAPQLHQFERGHAQGGRRQRLSQHLVRRISPTLRLHDLGRTTYEVNGLEIRASTARRKALSLLLYLVTRPKQTATREQAMEELWPNQSPASATNSLHQTLHFVRRSIAPWDGEGATADYVPLDADVLYLDPELVQVDSVAFHRQAKEALASGDPAKAGPSTLRLYGGKFAPEFEYEDWAEEWRNAVHTTFLHLTQATAAALNAAGRTQAVIEVLARALEIDPMALDLRSSLIRALHQAGAVDAATGHHRHFGTLMQREMGERAPPLEKLLEVDPPRVERVNRPKG